MSPRKYSKSSSVVLGFVCFLFFLFLGNYAYLLWKIPPKYLASRSYYKMCYSNTPRLVESATGEEFDGRIVELSGRVDLPWFDGCAATGGDMEWMTMPPSGETILYLDRENRDKSKLRFYVASRKQDSRNRFWLLMNNGVVVALEKSKIDWHNQRIMVDVKDALPY